MKIYYIIMTLNGNLRLKDTLGANDELEQEIYANSLKDAQDQFKAHQRDLKSQGLI